MGTLSKPWVSVKPKRDENQTPYGKNQTEQKPQFWTFFRHSGPTWTKGIYQEGEDGRRDILLNDDKEHLIMTLTRWMGVDPVRRILQPRVIGVKPGG